MKNMKGDKKMTQKNKSSSFGLSFSNALASQRWDLCVITHDLYNDFSHRHLLVSRLFSKVPIVNFSPGPGSVDIIYQFDL